MATHTNSGLDARLSFMRIDTQTINYIRELKPIIDRELPVALDRFYAQLRATPEVRRFFQNEAHMDRAKGAQVNHWSGMSSGVFDDRYVANVQTIGRTHARIGLEPRWYIGGYALIVEHLISAITTENAANARLWSRKQRLDSAQLGAAIGALVKVVMLDMDFSISVYIDAAEEGRRQAEDEAKAAERSLVSGSFGVGLQRLASKDLSYRMTEDLPPEYRQLQMDFNAALDQMEAAVEGVQSSAGIIASGSAEVTSAADDLSKRTEQQAASLEQTAAAVDQITATVKKAAEGARHASDVVAAAKANAETSGNVVKRTTSAMSAIENSAKQISQIISVIDEIAFQTNLLALNAGVEAARAGEAGRGFAVVASEVRALAQRSADAAKEIKGLIMTSSTQVADGVELVAQTGQSLERIIQQVAEISTIVTAMAAGTQEQATGLGQVNTAINQMDQGTQQNAAMVEESTATSHALAQEANRLSELVGTFNVRRRTGASNKARVATPTRVSAARVSKSGAAARPKVQVSVEPEWSEF